jgi:hypothetical protein
MIRRSVLFHCISSPVYEVKRLNQALCWPLGLIGCSPSLSSGFRKVLPQILYILQARTGQSHTVCTLSSLSYPHNRHSCRSAFPSLYKWALRLVWPVNSPTAAQSLNLLIARNSLALLDREYLVRILDCRQLAQIVHLAWCLSSNCFLTSFFFLPTPKGRAVNWLGGASIAPSLASLSAS